MLNILLRQRWMVIGLACFFGLFVVFVIDAHRTPTVVRYLEQKNIPANMEQLKAMYPEAPEAENGIALLFRAANKIKEPNRDEYEKIPFAGGSDVEFGAPLTTEQRNALQQYVDSHEEVLAMIYEALEYPYVRLTHYRYDIENDIYSKLRTLSRFLNAVAIHAAINNDVARSFEATKANFTVTEISIYGSDYMSELTRFAPLGLAIESIAKALSYSALTPPMIHTYMEILAMEEARLIKYHQDALKTNCALDLSIQRYYGRFFEKPKGQGAISLFLGRVGREWNQLAFFAERMYVKKLEEILDIGNQDIYTALSATSRNPKENIFSSPSSRSTEDTYCLLRQVYVDLYRSYLAPARYMATIAAARTALAAQLFYYDYGNMPDRLDALVPTYLDVLPRDPFTPDRSIRFRIDGDVARFYSIGRNEKDNGGVDDDDTCEDCDDIVFRLKVPQANTSLDLPSGEEL